MIDRRSSILIASVRKLSRRGAWKNVQRILSRSHTADIATLIQQVEPDERLTFFRMIGSMETRAGVISHLDAPMQTEILMSLDRKEAQQLVGQMDSDDAADVLGHLPDDVSKEILAAMVQEDSEEVADLLRYPEDSAGGIMSSGYLAITSETTISDAIKEIQKQHEESSINFYVYVIDDTSRLVGVLSLKDIILSKPEALIKDVMSSDVISVGIEMTQQEVARMVEKYDFLALPVLDSEHKLAGVITVDDIIDVIKEEAQEDLLAMGRAGWTEVFSRGAHFKARLPWLSLTFIGGIICYWIFSLFVPPLLPVSWWQLSGFIPLLLSIGSTAGHQSAAVAVGAVRGGQFNFKGMAAHLFMEVQVAIFFALIFGLVLFVLAHTIFDLNEWSYLIAIALALQLLLTVALGSLIPLTLQKMGLDPTIISIPLFTVLADISSVAILFGLLDLMTTPS